MLRRNKIRLSILLTILLILIFINIILLLNNIIIYNKAVKTLHNMQIEKAE